MAQPVAPRGKYALMAGDTSYTTSLVTSTRLVSIIPATLYLHVVTTVALCGTLLGERKYADVASILPIRLRFLLVNEEPWPTKCYKEPFLPNVWLVLNLAALRRCTCGTAVRFFVGVEKNMSCLRGCGLESGGTYAHRQDYCGCNSTPSPFSFSSSSREKLLEMPRGSGDVCYF